MERLRVQQQVEKFQAVHKRFEEESTAHKSVSLSRQQEIEAKQELKRQHIAIKQERKTVLSVATDYLRNGVNMVKYGRRGKPKPMHIYMADRKICWRDPKATSQTNSKKSKDRQIPITDIDSIQDGRLTDVFKRFPVKGKDDIRDKLSFSLMCQTRTLDLEAPSEIEKLLFLDKLKILLQY
jgi:hypothetical protein